MFFLPLSPEYTLPWQGIDCLLLHLKLARHYGFSGDLDGRMA
jgi:hypothetical protein